MTDALALLQARFVERCRADLEQLRGLGADHSELGMIAHRLAGSAGSFGYPEISRAAAMVDDHTRSGPGPSSGEVRALIEALEKAMVTGRSSDR